MEDEACLGLAETINFKMIHDMQTENCSLTIAYTYSFWNIKQCKKPGRFTHIMTGTKLV